MSASNDGSESVDQFLARIASLSKKNGDEEAERNRKMEEDMMQARKERQARRAERARSISPVKTGPAAPTSSPRTMPFPRERSIDPPVTFTPPSQAQTPSRIQRSESPLPSTSLISSPAEPSRPLPQPPQEEPTTPSSPPANSTGLSRRGTLSWQQRPTSRDSNAVRSRPLSGPRSILREPAEKPTVMPDEEDEPEPARADIAASLVARDPSWFRQTADRGFGSAAYRKTNEESTSPIFQSTRGLQLPGMAARSTHAELKQSASATGRAYDDVPAQSLPQNPPLEQSALDRARPEDTVVRSKGQPTSESRYPQTSVSPSIDLRPLQDGSGMLNRSSNILSTTARPPSPTKGLGGFVESAMMKRSDSVSKRWSVQANSGLKRGDSIASNRPTFHPPNTTSSLGHARTISRDPRTTRDGTSSPLNTSRPTSSHGPEILSVTAPQDSEINNSLSTRAPASQPIATNSEERPTAPPPEALLSRSPSKTLDPRRWSPTKASWLESALSKPDSPRPTASKPDTPAWKIGLQRSKSQRDLDRSPTRPASFDPEATGGLLRSPPPASPSKTESPYPDGPVNLVEMLEPTNALEQGLEQLAVKQETSGSIGENRGIASPSRGKSKDPSAARLISRQNINISQKTTGPSSTISVAPPREKSPAPRVEPDLKEDADKKPPIVKPKPQTPPKTDFRSSLRARQNDNTDSGKKEPEFKAVFGKLKRTQTQNYVAPDVFKENITRGKAALNTTGGPQPTKRVDEFKESILQKKEAMKAGGGSIHKRSESQTEGIVPEKASAEIAEALARRNTLHKTKASTDASGGKPSVQTSKPETWKPAMTPSLSVDSTSTSAMIPKPTLDQHQAPVKKSPAAGHGPTSKESRADIALRAERAMATSKPPFQKPLTTDAAPSPPLSEPISRTTSTSPDKELSRTSSSKLAARLNPALANLIARGNSPRPATDGPSPESRVTDKLPRSGITGAGEGSERSEGLTHITKARAKGPKRRAPKNEQPQPNLVSRTPNTPELSSTVKPAVAETSKEQSSQKDNSLNCDPQVSDLPRKTILKAIIADETKDALPRQPSQPAHFRTSVHSAGDTVTARPLVASKSPEVRRVLEKQTKESPHASVSPPKSTQSKPFDIAIDQGSQVAKPSSTPRQMDSTVRSTARPMPLTPSKSKVNSPKQPNPTVDSPVLKATPTAGLGLNFGFGAKQEVTAPVLTPPPEKDHQSSMKLGGDSNLEKTLLNLFGTMPKSSERLDFDTEGFLTAQSNDAERVKTLSNRMVEITGDGKQSPMPSSQEHLLYEGSMYLSVHTFESGRSKAAEVYLWCGDSVADAAVEDAQIFCRKVARDNSAKLELVKQGKETSRFFSALGGILIIRKSKSSALYMLCGRRHGGHVAFDEVDFTPASLCSGFSFLISARFGKLYLWKGAGSCADEIGAARLMGMDLGLTGEIEELSEGQEPATFWETFSKPSSKRDFQSLETWSMRAADEHKGFPCKLYRLEQDRPKSSGGFWGLRASSPPKSSNKATLQEISPFTQRDLDGNHVHLLDAYANIYILPVKASPAKSAEFVSALHIAQEMAVLAPSIQARALLPSCHVVLGEPTPEFKAAFRKWMPGVSVETRKESAYVNVSDVMRVLG